MRTMEIPGFPGRRIHITDLESVVKGRLGSDYVTWPEQAVPLVGYMVWPNDEAARNLWIDAHRQEDGSAIHRLVHKFKIVQRHWARVADIVSLHFDLAQGGHQKARGGASVGKAIALIDAKARSTGTSAAKLWENWATYKDVAHLTAAAVLVSGDAWARFGSLPREPKLGQFQPYRMAMLVPAVVLSVAMTIEDYGLQFTTRGSNKSLFDPETLWRIPADINLTPLPLPNRNLTNSDLAALNARRAGNRGNANPRKTTPVSA